MAVTKSYRSVEMAPTSAVISAARHVEREWGTEGYRIGYAGTTDPANGTAVHVFQVRASDGSRFLVWATRYGDVGDYTHSRELEAATALALDVEIC